MKIDKWIHSILAHRTEVFLCVLSLVLYIPGIDWGLPSAYSAERIQTWAQDDISPLGPLTETYDTFFQKAPNRWLPYPLGHHFLLTIVYSPYLLLLFITGKFKAPNPIYPYGFSDPVQTFKLLTLIARLISVGMSAAILLIVYRIGSLLWNKESGLAAASILLLTYPMFYYSKTANLEIPSLFWVSLGLLTYIKILQVGITMNRAMRLGLFIAMAAATKDQTAGLFLLPLVYLLAFYLKNTSQQPASRWQPIVAFLAVGSSVYVIFSGLAFDPARYFSHIHWLLFKNAVIHAEYIRWFPFTIPGTIGLLGDILHAQFWIFGPLLLLSAIAAMIYVSRDESGVSLLLPLLSYILLFVFIIHYFRIRYAMPLLLILSLFAARGIILTLRSWRTSRTYQLLAMIVFLSWPAIFSSDLLFQLFHDSRKQAAHWITVHQGSSRTLAYCGSPRNLPHVPPDISLVSLSDRASTLERVRQLPAGFIVVMPDWTSKPGMEFSRTCPEQLYARLNDGSLGYKAAAYFKTRSLIPIQLLDYPSVNPPVRIYVRGGKYQGN